jgi:hypothetical protein
VLFWWINARVRAGLMNEPIANLYRGNEEQRAACKHDPFPGRSPFLLAFGVRIRHETAAATPRKPVIEFRDNYELRTRRRCAGTKVAEERHGQSA